MRQAKQAGFKLLENQSIKKFGGDLLKNSNPKAARPISTKKSMHLVLRSSKAIGAHSLLKANTAIFEVISRQSKKFGVKVYRYANGGNHLHLIILPRSRKAYQDFIRAVSGLIARLILKAQKGSPKLNENSQLKFWDKRPFTRLVEWGKDFSRTSDYLLQNTLEAIGFIAYKPRNKSKIRLSSA